MEDILDVERLPVKKVAETILNDLPGGYGLTTMYRTTQFGLAHGASSALRFVASGALRPEHGETSH